MEKNFHKWCVIKEKLDKILTRPNFSARDIWFCYLGANVGDEQNASQEDDFIRPVVIIRKFNNHLCWIVPLTKTQKSSQHYVSFSFIGLDVSTAIISQIRSIDASRLTRKIGYMRNVDYKELSKKLKEFLP